LVLENGKLTKKKQPYYANNLERLKTNINSPAPGPGYYSYATIASQTIKKSQKYNIIPKRRTPTKNIENSKPKTNSPSILGPGEYEINLQTIKPRVKGVSEWGKTSIKEVSEQIKVKKNDEEEYSDIDNMPIETENSEISGNNNLPQISNKRYNYLKGKELSSFASRVPRFSEGTTKPKYEIKETVSLSQQVDINDTNLMLEKNLEHVLVNVFLYRDFNRF